MGHILLKPYGYAGDFEIIDRIYTKNKSEKYSKWDDYSLSNSAAVAVRNRKDYFKAVIKEQVKGRSELMVLNLASGPARDVFEIFEEAMEDRPKLKFTCIDLDKNAISYAKEINSEHLDQIEFVNKNILRFDTTVKHDLVWSAGLFDYFNDKVFILILKRMKNWIKENGEIVIGNFNQEYNPSRHYMEIIGEWYLHHRTEEQLRALAVEAGFSEENITVGRENENVNLFLHLKNG
jgi:2-polyprenyl-3-methyl-5-hydroxy-6-metoxy-1,4-benzoquinol methylase